MKSTFAIVHQKRFAGNSKREDEPSFFATSAKESRIASTAAD
jgi:hypothetical protein